MNGVNNLIFGLIIGIALGGASVFFAMRGRNNGAVEKELRTQLEKATEEISIKNKLEEMQNAVKKLSEEASDADRRRIQSETLLAQQMKQMAIENENLAKQTKSIAGALSSSQARGRYGELHLETLLESAGLIEPYHFVRQTNIESDEDGAARPDITVNTNSPSKIFIDSKFPFERFYEAFETEDEERRKELLLLHAKDLLKHAEALAKRRYAEKGNSADFVILYLPIDAIYIEAVNAIPDFLSQCFKLNVTVATPANMMALLRTVSFIYSKNKVAENAELVRDEAVKFMKDLGSLYDRIETVGDRLESAVKAYNEMIPSAETTVVRTARRMKELDVQGRDLTPIEPVENNVRQLNRKLELEE
jgi:DNA recombination protein RmuC